MSSPPEWWAPAGATGAAAVDWITAQRAAIDAAMGEYGAVLLRGLTPGNADEVEALTKGLIDRPMTEREGFAGRRTYGPGLYSSADWPPDQPMCAHHELSYAGEVPTRILFACLTAPAVGGRVGLADATAVLAALPADIRSRFAEEGWILTRSYTETVGVSWQSSFGTNDRAAVDRYCREHRIEVDWRSDGGLRTRQHRPAVTRHPVTGAECWFNQIAFLNEWTLDPIIRDYLLFEFGADGLPFNSRYGNGDPIPEGVIEAVNAVYEAATVRPDWRAGDILLVDNIRTAHSREEYEGDRQVVVALGDGIPAGVLAAAVAEGLPS